ncbi:MAG: HAMP domain-containing sensor histidine kinase [Bacteroidota bacterium]
MERHTNRLYTKISLTLLLMLGVLGVAYLVITGFTARTYMQEVHQRLYGGIADSTASVAKPLVDGTVSPEAMKDIMHSMMVINPSVEVYLLDKGGKIVNYVAPHKKIKLDSVGLGPVKKFIAAADKPFILGDDPRHPEKQNIFSASKIINNGTHEGYVYIILGSEEQTAVSGTLMGSYFLKLGTNYFFITLFGALGIGLLAIWLLTRNLRSIIATVTRFKEGDMSARISQQDGGDLQPLGETFNQMADTIVAHIEQIQSIESLRRELIANVSHDLRTPLAIMQGYAETLSMKDEQLNSEDRQRYLGMILNSAGRLSRLINQLFEYSKLEAEQVVPEKEPFFISDLAQDVYQKYQILAQEKGITLHIDMPQQLPLVFADVALVERVLQNLMDNALKFTPENGEVRIELSQQEEGVTVGIVDNGPGIPQEQQPYIFERYHQVAGEKTKKSGAGLGLAIVKKILELHDASIQVRSKLQEGTEFSFMLPAFAG